MRRRVLLLTAIGLLGLLPLAACSRFAGPLESNPRNAGRVDAPWLSIEEQQKRGRERLAITEDDYRIGPKGYIDRPSPLGR